MTLEKLQLGYINGFLIYRPIPNHVNEIATWQTRLVFCDSGKTRPVGVSDSPIERLERIEAAAGIFPEANQIEARP